MSGTIGRPRISASAFTQQGWLILRITRVMSLSDAAIPIFFDAYTSGIWLYVIQTLGPNLIQAGFLEESVCLRAEEDYGDYVQHALRLQRHPMLTVEGRRPC